MLKFIYIRYGELRKVERSIIFPIRTHSNNQLSIGNIDPMKEDELAIVRF
jgi:hypothetical protein